MLSSQCAAQALGLQPDVLEGIIRAVAGDNLVGVTGYNNYQVFQPVAYPAQRIRDVLFAQNVVEQMLLVEAFAVLQNQRNLVLVNAALRGPHRRVAGMAKLQGFASVSLVVRYFKAKAQCRIYLVVVVGGWLHVVSSFKGYNCECQLGKNLNPTSWILR